MATTAIEFTKDGSDYICNLADYQTNIGGGN